MASANDLMVLFFLFYFLSLPIALARAPDTVVNSSGGSGHCGFVPGQSVQSFIIWWQLEMFCICSLSSSEIPFNPYFYKRLSFKNNGWVWNFAKCFHCIQLTWLCFFFFLQLVYMVDYIVKIFNLLNQYYILRMTSTWSYLLITLFKKFILYVAEFNLLILC
jgi:hypothetical protein